MLMLSSYDYLGLIGDPRVDERPSRPCGSTAPATGGVRMLTGTIDLHHKMERELADFKGTAEAITFSSGYLANLAVIAALLYAAGPGDSRFPVAPQPGGRLPPGRRSAAALPPQRPGLAEARTGGGRARQSHADHRRRRVFDGRRHLPAARTGRDQEGVRLLSDGGRIARHGRAGQQRPRHRRAFRVRPADVDIWTGSLAKAIPVERRLRLPSQELAIYLQHAAAPFIFSAALCPVRCRAVRETLAILRSEPERVDPATRKRRIPARRPARSRLRHRALETPSSR